jgi:hypothetical protein
LREDPATSFKAGTELANFDRGPPRGRALARERNRRLARFAGEQKETTYHFLRLGKWTVDPARRGTHPCMTLSFEPAGTQPDGGGSGLSLCRSMVCNSAPAAFS